MLLSRRFVTVLEGRVGREQAALPSWHKGAGCCRRAVLRREGEPHSSGLYHGFLDSRLNNCTARLSQQARGRQLKSKVPLV